MKKFSFLLFLFLSALCFTPSLYGQSIRTEFGKNRIQYHDDFNKWWEYETENFIVYWYGKGRNVAQSAIQIAEYSHSDIQDIVEHRINDKIEIIVYTDLSDLLQSNIGTEETFETRNDETKVIGSRIFVYFDGNHQNLKRQIKNGIAHVYINSMYAPNGLQSIIESDPELDIPKWYQKGFISYAGSQWDPYIEDEIRDIWSLDKKRFKDFDCLSRDYPRLAGHTFWHYLETKFGKTSITTLLYLMRLRNDLDENIEFVFGFDMKKLKKDWSRYYDQKFSNERDYIPFPEDEKINLGFKKYFPKSHFSLSPDGQSLIYAVNQQGKFQIVLYDLNTAEKTTIMKYGSKNAVQETDYNYPMVAWSPYSPEITIAYENRDVITLRKVDLTNGSYQEQTIPENLQRIYSIDYISEDEYLFSGVENGFSDLYTYHSRYRRVTTITEDYHDDIDASYVQLGEQYGILFSSNRTESQILKERIDTILPTSNFDIYFLPLDGEFALKLTNTPNRNEKQPRLINDNLLTYLDDHNGMKNRWILDLNSRRGAYLNSDYSRNIINHEAISQNGTYVFQVYNNAAYETYISQPDLRKIFNSDINSSAPGNTINQSDNVQTTLLNRQLVQSKYDDPEELEPLESNADYKIVNRNYQRIPGANKNRKVIKFIPARAVASRRQFKIEQVITKVDNEVLFDGLETTAIDNEIEAQPTGFLIQGIAKDIFEDFEVSLGARFPTDFRGSEFFAYVDDKRKRIDRRYAIYHRQKGSELFGERLREQSLVGLYRLSYPFDTYTSLRGTASLRIDKTFLLNRNPAAVEFGQSNEQRISLKGEYIFDNTLNIDLNLRHGTKYKAYIQAINRFDLSIQNGFDFDLSRGFATIIGFDARHYIPFLQNSIIALRASGASSFGSEKMLYTIGGTDGWITPKYNQDIPVPANTNFAFKTLAPNLRGFDHNIRNGHNYLIGSAELRIPIIKYFSRSELRSKFLRNIQLTAFFDTGSAWHGLLPSSSENDVINTATVTGPGILVQVDLDRSTFVYGYGFGARIQLLGHYIRGDYAWGVESGLINDPKFTISLGTEF